MFRLKAIWRGLEEDYQDLQFRFLGFEDLYVIGNGRRIFVCNWEIWYSVRIMVRRSGRLWKKTKKTLFYMRYVYIYFLENCAREVTEWLNQFIKIVQKYFYVSVWKPNFGTSVLSLFIPNLVPLFSNKYKTHFQNHHYISAFGI